LIVEHGASNILFDFLQIYAKTPNRPEAGPEFASDTGVPYFGTSIRLHAPSMNLFHRLPRLLLFSFWLLGGLRPLAASAQLEQTKRLEFERRPSTTEDFEVLALGHDGVLLTKKTQDYFAGAPYLWHFTQYDTDMNVRWETDLKVRFPMEPLLSYHNAQYLFWLFGDPESQKINVLRLHLSTGEQELIEGELLAVDDVSHFRVLGNTAFVAGHYRERAVVVRFDFFSRQSRVLPGLYVNRLSVSSLELDEAAEQVNVIVTTSRKNRCQLALRTYSYEGKLLRETPLPAEDGRTLLSGKVVPLGAGESLLVGNYSANCSPYAQGVYVAQLAEGAPTAVKYLEFTQFKNFFNYLKPGRRQRVLDRIARKREEGKEAKFRYLMLVHDLVPTDEGFLLVAEAFFPQYRSTPTAGFLPLSRGVTDRSLEGYRYTHAMICGFDKTGKLLWDNCLAMPDRLSYELEEQVQLTRQTNDRLVLAYPLEDKISTLVIRGNEVVEDKGEYDLAPKNGPERILSNDNTTLAAWYGQYFLAWGTQKKAGTRETASREVFYLDKLSYPVR